MHLGEGVDDMKIVKVERHGKVSSGVVSEDKVLLLDQWQEGPSVSAAFRLPELTQQELASRMSSPVSEVPMEEVTLAPPCDPLRKVICVGMNYRDHTTEIAHDIGDYPVLFTRSLDSLVGADQPVVAASASEMFDFEGEIAVVIGRAGRHIAASDAMDYVFGYSCFFDGSIRQYQRHSLTAGKNFEKSGGMGPWIVTRDEIGKKDLRLCTRLNGQQVQEGHLSDLIFDIPTVIEYCSRWTTLRPGDVIATGTPGGVGARRTPPLWLKPGDKIEVDVSTVGTLRHEVIAEASA